MRRECRERFPCNRLQRKSLVSDPGMHHSSCVTHVPWCMSGSLTRGSGKNAPGISGACTTRNFTYLARGPCMWYAIYTWHYTDLTSPLWRLNSPATRLYIQQIPETYTKNYQSSVLMRESRLSWIPPKGPVIRTVFQRHDVIMNWSWNPLSCWIDNTAL